MRQRVGHENHFLAIGEAIAVGIREGGISSEGGFLQVWQTVPIGIDDEVAHRDIVHSEAVAVPPSPQLRQSGSSLVTIPRSSAVARGSPSAATANSSWSPIGPSSRSRPSRSQGSP